jgi:hypothetical protein
MAGSLVALRPVSNGTRENNQCCWFVLAHDKPTVISNRTSSARDVSGKKLILQTVKMKNWSLE